MTSPRRRLSADERRAQLAHAAIEVIAESGFAGATADAIAEHAGVSKGLLWHYFDDRDALLQRCCPRRIPASFDPCAPL